MAVEALSACHAEAAAHLAARLGADTEGSTVVIRDIDGFDIYICAIYSFDNKQILLLIIKEMKINKKQLLHRHQLQLQL
mgnify:CR=1 FL=1